MQVQVLLPARKNKGYKYDDCFVKSTYLWLLHLKKEITNLMIEIAEFTGQIFLSDRLYKNPKLCKENRIRSIFSSLAIEQNSFSIDQVSDTLEGKRVLGPPQDIREVKNAYEVYELRTIFSPYLVKGFAEDA